MEKYSSKIDNGATVMIWCPCKGGCTGSCKGSCSKNCGGGCKGYCGNKMHNDPVW